MFSNVAIPFYNPTRSIRGFQFLHTLNNIGYYLPERAWLPPSSLELRKMKTSRNSSVSLGSIRHYLPNFSLRRKFRKHLLSEHFPQHSV